MSKLTSPIVLIAIGLILGVAPGMFIFWKAALPLVAAAREAAAKAGAPEKPEAPWDFWTIEIENVATELKDSRALLKKLLLPPQIATAMESRLREITSS